MEIIAKNCNVDAGLLEPVEESREVDLAGMTLRFLDAPGHSPAGTVVVVDGEAAFAGDTIFPGSCGRLDLPGSSVDVP